MWWPRAPGSVEQNPEGTVWIGGNTVTVVEGTIATGSAGTGSGVSDG